MPVSSTFHEPVISKYFKHVAYLPIVFNIELSQIAFSLKQTSLDAKPSWSDIWRMHIDVNTPGV